MDLVRWIVGVPLLALGVIGTMGNLAMYFRWYVLKHRFNSSSVPLSCLFSLAGFLLLPLHIETRWRLGLAAGLVIADVSTWTGLPWLAWQAIRGFPADPRESRVDKKDDTD